LLKVALHLSNLFPLTTKPFALNQSTIANLKSTIVSNFLKNGEFFGDNPLFLLPEFEIQHSLFKIRYSHGAVAQLVEQRTENPCVGGSIPPHTTEAGKSMLQSVFPFLFSSKTCFRRAK
jgi:hypothetical protein